jgi:hypothetical protein|tara:strand:- start:59 stop:331 length:273 start_codon:yes stop_codon:yes gene_type:complete
MAKRKKDIKISDDLLHIEQRVELADRLKDSWHLLDVHMDSIKDAIEKVQRHDTVDLDFVTSLRRELNMLSVHALICSYVTLNFLEDLEDM